MAINIPNINTHFVKEDGKATQAFFRPLADLFKFANDSPVILDYEGTPEGNLTARYKDMCWDSINSKLYFKSTATGDTGWIALN